MNYYCTLKISQRYILCKFIDAITGNIQALHLGRESSTIITIIVIIQYIYKKKKRRIIKYSAEFPWSKFALNLKLLFTGYKLDAYSGNENLSDNFMLNNLFINVLSFKNKVPGNSAIKEC